MDDTPGFAGNLRRRLLSAGVGLGAWFAMRATAASPDDLTAAIDAYSDGAVVRPGKVTLDVPKLVDNGNTVPVTVSVASAMSGTDHVVAIALFNERNPERDVAQFRLGPRAGRARVSTRIRLATSQKLVAVARMGDGTYWSDSVEVVVVLAACIEGDV